MAVLQGLDHRVVTEPCLREEAGTFADKLNSLPAATVHAEARFRVVVAMESVARYGDLDRCAYRPHAFVAEQAEPPHQQSNRNVLQRVQIDGGDSGNRWLRNQLKAEGNDLLRVMMRSLARPPPRDGRAADLVPAGLAECPVGQRHSATVWTRPAPTRGLRSWILLRCPGAWGCVRQVVAARSRMASQLFHRTGKGLLASLA